VAKALKVRLIRWLVVMVIIYAGTALGSCYDHMHPPVTPDGNPADYPPLTDSKAAGAAPDGGGTPGPVGAGGASGLVGGGSWSGGFMAGVDVVTR
jgi:hypothetical protein